MKREATNRVERGQLTEREGRYAGSMLELLGDSARGEEFALVRLTVDGERIVAADAPGLAQPLEGLTLLEAAAVPGETLAADALANALAPAFRAEPKPERIAAKPSFALKLTKEAVNRSVDVMGQPAAIEQAFALHQLCHAHNLQEFGMVVDPAGLHPSVRKSAQAK